MGKEIELNDSNFDNEVLKSDKPVFVDFWAAWCGPCKMAAPIVEEIAVEYEGKIKVCKCNVDNNSSLAAKYNVSSIPTFILFNNGKETTRSTGASSKEGLVKIFKDLKQ